MREGAAGKGRRWQHRALRDCEELRGAGEVSGVPIPRALSAKQRRLDPSLLELGALGSVGAGWAWPESQALEMRLEEAREDKAGDRSRHVAASSSSAWQLPAPLSQGSWGCPL